MPSTPATGHHPGGRGAPERTQRRLQTDRREEKSEGRRRRDHRPDGRGLQPDQGTRRNAEADGRGAPVDPDDDPQHPARIGRLREGRRGQSGHPRLGRKALLLIHAAAALGDRREPEHPGFRPRGEDHRRALHALPGTRRKAGAGAHQLHARPPHPGARLHRGPHPLHGQPGEHDGHGAAPQVRGGPLPDRRGGLLPHPDGGGPRDKHPPGRDPGREGAPDLLRAPTPPASVPRPAPTGRTPGGLSASTSSTRWNWSSSRSRRTPTRSWKS